MNRKCCQYVLVIVGMLASTPVFAERQVIDLDGTWQIAEGTMDKVPTKFSHQVPVPGLVDMARPAFREVGTAESPKIRKAFWYRRTFKLDGEVPDRARLKINKAKFGTRVFMNGELVGEHLPCFTPALLDVRKFLKGTGEENELIVRVGAWRDAVPATIPYGWDFEKIRYLPGIYDSVRLILSGTPHVERVQIVPDVPGKKARVSVILQSTGGLVESGLTCRVLEKSTGKKVGEIEKESFFFKPGEPYVLNVEIPISGCRLWSPEDPFLYLLETSTTEDTLTTPFGMRSFSFDPKSKRALLNGKPYPMRGTNVCIFRFFEDDKRGDRPWREEWVRRLHRTYKGMHWNSARYCIGFPPEKWYDVADELGILIQDEFPLWYLSQWPKELKQDELIEEYTEWMQERWNHPCVVIWDAQNESRTAVTGLAIQSVRNLDLSKRPWDNGWSPPQAATDLFEAHPYPFFSAKGSGQAALFRLPGLTRMPQAPGVADGIRGSVIPNAGGNPAIVNEYGWLWLNRDGKPTTVSAANYKAMLGEKASVDERRRLYAHHVAAMTEFWRSGRQVAGVMHFCGLGYSRPNGDTSDPFLDIEKLTLEPHFQREVRDSFAPVGVSIHYWEQALLPETKVSIPVIVINDLADAWRGNVTLRIMQGKKTLHQKSQSCQLAGLERKEFTFPITTPPQPGTYELVAELTTKPAVKSHRMFPVVAEEVAEEVEEETKPAG